MKYLLTITLASLLYCCTQPEKHAPLVEDTAHLRDSSMAPFYHGVASGDPLYSQVIIWTRVTPEDSLPEVDVVWEIAADDSFQEIIKTGTVTTDPGRDYTVKIDVDGLSEGQKYFYRFHALGKSSMIGRTKTASIKPQNLMFGVVSCSNYEWGYFNSYGALAQENLDAVIHLGDYIYEYAPGGYGDTTLGRSPIPNKEIITLQDYRSRYSQYRLDKDLIAAHANHPFINIWDDHEIANNSYKDGAQNHQPDEGSYEERKNIARQVFYEWIPIRESDQHYRKLQFGDMADLIMLDERLERTFIADSLGDPTLMDSSRTMLGKEQLLWFTTQLKVSQAKWKVVGNQVIYSYLNWGHEDFTINLDSWDGYPIEQQQIADVIKSKPVENVVFITGDTHTAWAFESTNKPFDEYNQETGEGAFAVEFGTTSINSANSNESYSDSVVLVHENRITDSPVNPHLKWTNMRDHGYMILTLTEDRAMATWKFMKTIEEPSLEIKEVKNIWMNSGEVKLQSN
ncbi:alkaline phosphatase D [Ekhidna lutea]|uniref:Alkaline phosphatase D n=1 Tax=Ekhidna lutea TaxID=447679 RepID=A0A239KEN1_EKHLU|nr:alkaline phosphatase D family protein [Ekhidna lutea]SNT16148.1 alkaline phosphatase D [Ekhidna lutea]